MATEDVKIHQITQKWNDLIKRECGQNLADSELSSLSSWVVDCYEGYKEIYKGLLEKIRTASLDDRDLLHDCVVDIYWQLDHIKNHINASEKGFAKLIRKLSTEGREKEGIGVNP
jgi:hypothetical protein